jgi:two-component system alkaline phosphatase synthesis response regulator PhoP
MGTSKILVLTRILVVDDYPAIRAVVATLLKSAGFVVECANSGEDALRSIITSRTAFDVLVTDLQMPGMWGDELTRRAREHSPSLRVVLMTGEPDALPDPVSLDWLNVAVLRKPFPPADLFGAVRSVLTWDAIPVVNRSRCTTPRGVTNIAITTKRIYDT